MSQTKNPETYPSDFLPKNNQVQNLGSPSQRWGTVYAEDLDLDVGISSISDTAGGIVACSAGGVTASFISSESFAIRSLGSPQFSVLSATRTGGILSEAPLVLSNYTLNSKVRKGTFVANGITGVTISADAITANSVVLFGLKTVGGTTAPVYMDTVTPGTGFTIKSTAGNTSTYNFAIIDIA